MLREISFHSGHTVDAKLSLGQSTRWLNELFLEGLIDLERIPQIQISIDLYLDKFYEPSILPTFISIRKIFDYDFYSKIETTHSKCQYMLDFMFKTLCEFDFGVPISFWQAGYDHCVKNNFVYRFTQTRKPLVYKRLKKSFALHVELDFYELKLFIEITPLDGDEKVLVLVAVLRPCHIDNFRFYHLTKNKDNTFNIVDKAYYSRKLYLESIDLNNPTVFRSDLINFPKRAK